MVILLKKIKILEKSKKNKKKVILEFEQILTLFKLIFYQYYPNNKFYILKNTLLNLDIKNIFQNKNLI